MFFQDPFLKEGTHAQVFPEQTCLAILTRFQRSSNSRAKVVGLWYFSEVFQRFCQLQGFQSQVSYTQLGLQVNSYMQKILELLRKTLARTCVYLDLAFFVEYSGKSRFITAVFPQNFFPNPLCIDD